LKRFLFFPDFSTEIEKCSAQAKLHAIGLLGGKEISKHALNLDCVLIWRGPGLPADRKACRSRICDRMQAIGSDRASDLSSAIA
jgi:hypothetical protein